MPRNPTNSNRCSAFSLLACIVITDQHNFRLLLDVSARRTEADPAVDSETIIIIVIIIVVVVVVISLRHIIC